MWERQENVARDGDMRGERVLPFPRAPRSLLRPYDFQAPATHVKWTEKR